MDAPESPVLGILEDAQDDSHGKPDVDAPEQGDGAVGHGAVSALEENLGEEEEPETSDEDVHEVLKLEEIGVHEERERDKMPGPGGGPQGLAPREVIVLVGAHECGGEHDDEQDQAVVPPTGVEPE
jgi:hypothetical protein